MRSTTGRRLVAVLCMAAVLCIAASPAASWVLVGILTPFAEWTDSSPWCIAPRSGHAEAACADGPSAAAPRAPPLA